MINQTERPQLRKRVALGALALISLGTVGFCAYGLGSNPNLLNPSSRPAETGAPTPTALSASLMEKTSTLPLTENPWIIPTKPSIQTVEKVAKACKAKVETMGHFNQHPELPIFEGEAAVSAVNWFRQYFINYGGDQNDPVIGSLKEQGIKQYDDLMTFDDMQAFLVADKPRGEETGKKFLVYVFQAKDAQRNLIQIVSQIDKLVGVNVNGTEFARLAEKLGLNFKDDGKVEAEMAYYFQGKEGTETVVFDPKANLDVWPNGPLKGTNRFVVMIPVGYDFGLVRSNTLDFEGARAIMVDDFATTVVVDGKEYKCPGSINDIHTKTPTPTGTYVVTPTPEGPTQTPGGPTQTPKPPTETPRPTETPFASATPQRATDVPTATEYAVTQTPAPSPTSIPSGPSPTFPPSPTRSPDNTPVPPHTPRPTNTPGAPENVNISMINSPVWALTGN